MLYNPYCKNLKTRIFDIETTGFYANQDLIISASFCDTNGDNLKQFFCETPQAEDFLISQILEELSHCDVVVTYNGNVFDIPFVLTRAQKYRLCENLPVFWPADIYRWLKGYWPLSERMPGLSQKSVEFALGLEKNRTDEIGGEECIALYSEYLSRNKSEAKQLILLHNGDDVRQLARITEKLSFLPYHKIAFEKGFMVRPGIVTSGTKSAKNKYSVKGRAPKGALPADIFADSYRLQYDSKSGAVNLVIYTQKKEAFKFIDLKADGFKTADFEHFKGYQSGFLVLQDGDNINFAEFNALAAKIIGSL